MADDANTAHPESTFGIEYPYNIATITRGGHEFHINDTPGKESIKIYHTNGTYWEINETGRVVNNVVGKQYQYNADNVATTMDGHNDTKVYGTQRTNIDGSTSSETGGNEYSGTSGITVNGNKGSVYNASTEGDRFDTTKGNVVTDHEGSVNYNITGDFVQQTTGNRAEMIDGEMSFNVQGGNMDTQVDGGKYRVKADGEILIESDVKITLKVGKSTITMLPSKITVISPKIDLNPE